MSKTDALRSLIEIKHGHSFEALVKERVEAGWTQEEIADFLELPYWTFRYLLRQSGARFTRSISFGPQAEQSVSP